MASLKADAVSFSGSIKYSDFSDITNAIIKNLRIEAKHYRTKRAFDLTINKALQEEVVEKTFLVLMFRQIF